MMKSSNTSFLGGLLYNNAEHGTNKLSLNIGDEKNFKSSFYTKLENSFSKVQTFKDLSTFINSQIIHLANSIKIDSKKPVTVNITTIQTNDTKNVKNTIVKDIIDQLKKFNETLTNEIRDHIVNELEQKTHQTLTKDTKDSLLSQILSPITAATKDQAVTTNIDHSKNLSFKLEAYFKNVSNNINTSKFVTDAQDMFKTENYQKIEDKTKMDLMTDLSVMVTITHQQSIQILNEVIKVYDYAGKFVEEFNKHSDIKLQFDKQNKISDQIENTTHVKRRDEELTGFIKWIAIALISVVGVIIVSLFAKKSILTTKKSL